MSWEVAHHAFINLRINAQKKRVPWNLTFRDFVDVWGEHFARRGELQLQRIVPAAGYVPGNLRIGPRP